MRTTSIIDETTANKVVDAIVIGAGFMGCMTAKKLAGKGYNVILVDSGSEPVGINSTSYNQCYKLHTGVHYLGDLATAIKCLDNSLAFGKEFKSCILSIDNPNAPPRRGQHFIMSNSLFGEKNNSSNDDKINYAKKMCEQLREHYRNKANKDPELLEIFGTPEDFIKYLKPESYQDTVQEEIRCLKEDGSEEAASVILGIETPESQVDIKKIREYFNTIINESKNITFKKNSRVIRVQQEHGSLTQTIELANGEFLRSKCVINCAWNKIEEIAKKSNIFVRSETREVRAKISIQGVLPKELKGMNTRIFSIGPHASITNLYEEDESERSAIITYEPITNALFFDPTTLQGSQELANFKKEISTKGKKEQLTKLIISGAGKYTKHMEKVVPLETRVGYVKVFKKEEDSTSIYDPNSIIHRRTDEGVEEFVLGHFACHGMKATYTPLFAENALCVFEQQIRKIGEIGKIINIFKTEFELSQKTNGDLFLINTLIYVSLKNYWESISDINEKLSANFQEIFQRIREKQPKLNEEIRNFSFYRRKVPFYPNQKVFSNQTDFGISDDYKKREQNSGFLTPPLTEFSYEHDADAKAKNIDLELNEITQAILNALEPQHLELLTRNPNLLGQVYNNITMSISPPENGKQNRHHQAFGLFAKNKMPMPPPYTHKHSQNVNYSF